VKLSTLFVFPIIAVSMFCVLCPVTADSNISEVDDLKREITLRAPAKRIVSLAPNITELLFHIGAGANIVGVDEFSNYPHEAKSITRVNNHSRVNYELILSLQPDLVFAWSSGNGFEIVQRLSELELTVFVIEVTKLSHIPELLKKLGRLTDKTIESKRIAADFQKKLRYLNKSHERKKKVKTFYQIWDDPIMTLNGEHLVSDVIRICGGVNIFATSSPLVPRVNIETIMKFDPEVILSSGTQERLVSWKKTWSRWRNITAVKGGHLYLIPPDLMQRPTYRTLDGATYMCKYLDRYREYGS
tara:strand:- start:2299 stop:3201 length:903 start_codon:yes stop_codon:yes gene_type:complete